MGLFKKRRPLESLHVSSFAADNVALAQDNVSGPDVLGFEAIEHADAERERQRYLARSGGLRGFGSFRRFGLSVPASSRQTLDRGSLFPVPRPEKDESDD